MVYYRSIAPLHQHTWFERPVVKQKYKQVLSVTDNNSAALWKVILAYQRYLPTKS